MKKIIIIFGILLVFSVKANATDFPYDSILNLKLGMTRDEVKSHLDSLNIKWEERKDNEGGKYISVDFLLYKPKRNVNIYGNKIYSISIGFENKKINKIFISLDFEERGIFENKMEEMSNCYFITDKKIDTYLYLFGNCNIEYTCKLYQIEILQKSEKYKCKE